MKYETFLERVQELANVDRQQAERVIEATLATLAERLYRTRRDKIAAQLPDELKAPLLEDAESEVSREQVDRFSQEEFLNRVSARAEIGYPAAQEQTEVVFGVLREATSRGLVEEMLSALPEEYQAAFGAQP